MRRLSLLSLAALTLSVAAAPKERRFRIDYQVSIDKLPVLTERVELWVPVPHNDRDQTITKLDITGDETAYKVYTGENGNRMLHVVVSKPLRPNLLLDVQFQVKRLAAGPENATRPEKDPQVERWLEPDRESPVDESTRSKAKALTEGGGGAGPAVSNLEKARVLYQYAADTFAAMVPRTTPDCAGMSGVLVSLARSAGIPARFVAGFTIPAQPVFGSLDRHGCWVEFYIEGNGWVPADPVDPLNRKFGALDENRVAITLGRALKLNPPQRGAPLSYFIYPYAEVDGKPYSNVKAKVRYADLSAR